MRRFLVALLGVALLSAGCSSTPSTTQPNVPALAGNDSPANATSRLVGAYRQKNQAAYADMLTGDFNFQFSPSTDPALVQQYPTGWARLDETESSSHLFTGFTPQGGAAMPAASNITIVFADSVPADDNSPGVDPATHKILDTRVDGTITVPQSGGSLVYSIANNEDIIYFVRGDAAALVDTTQVADAQHWYVYKWKDVSQNFIPRPNSSGVLAKASTWGGIKATYR
jgi:hypothetical protein